MPTSPLTSNRKGSRNSDQAAHFMQGPVFSCSLQMIHLVRDFNRHREANTLSYSLGAVYRIPMSSQGATKQAVSWDTVCTTSGSQGISTLKTSCGLSSQENKHVLLARLSGKIRWTDALQWEN